MSICGIKIILAFIYKLKVMLHIKCELIVNKPNFRVL